MHAVRGWGDVQTRIQPEFKVLERFLGERLQDRNGPEPKYKVLHNALMEAIQQGVVAKETRLPTETELTRITPFSLGTVQRALKNLVDAGIIVRKPGVGTIVSPWRWELEHPLHTRFLDEEGDVLPVYTRVSSRRRISARGPWSEFLDAGDQTLVIKRQLNAGGRFVIYNEFYVDGARYPVFRDTPRRALNGVNFKHLLVREFNLAISRVSNRLSIATATPKIAPILGVAADTHCLRQRVFVFSDNSPLYYQDYWIPPQSQELVIDSAFEGPAKI